MYVNLRELVPESSGAIIRIEDGYYGQNYEFAPIVELNQDELFIFSTEAEYLLVQISEKSGKVIMTESKDAPTNKIFGYIKSLRKQ